MNEKIIGFDLMMTSAITKSPISDRMAGILSRLLRIMTFLFRITVVMFPTDKKQVIDRLNVTRVASEVPRDADSCGTDMLSIWRR